MERIANIKEYQSGEWAYSPDSEKPIEQIEYLTSLLHQIKSRRQVFIAKITGWQLKEIEASLEDLSKEIEVLKNDMQFLAASIVEEKIFQYKAAKEIVMKTMHL